jgi:hypothetical protein
VCVCVSVLNILIRSEKSGKCKYSSVQSNLIKLTDNSQPTAEKILFLSP